VNREKPYFPIKPPLKFEIYGPSMIVDSNLWLLQEKITENGRLERT